jgi:hypothetical protein
MSTSEAERADPPVTEKALRTVSPRRTDRENSQMNAIGWILLLGLVVIALPLLPFVAAVWLFSKVRPSSR